jgi:hopanoid-associated phosphorylase
MQTALKQIGIVVGLPAEAALLPGAWVACGGSNSERAYTLAKAMLADGAKGLVSFGIAGGLDPKLRPGDLVIASEVDDGTMVYEADPAWRHRLCEGLSATEGVFYGGADVVATPAQKWALHISAKAIAVDMESGPVARACREAGKPFAVLRAIADPAGRALPALALTALDEAGRPQIGKVMLGLLRRPGDLPGLIKLGLDSRTALRSLGLAVGRLGPALGFQAV